MKMEQALLEKLSADLCGNMYICLSHKAFHDFRDIFVVPWNEIKTFEVLHENNYKQNK